jgi:hypothetical protein
MIFRRFPSPMSNPQGLSLSSYPTPPKLVNSRIPVTAMTMAIINTALVLSIRQNLRLVPPWNRQLNHQLSHQLLTQVKTRQSPSPSATSCSPLLLPFSSKPNNSLPPSYSFRSLNSPFQPLRLPQLPPFFSLLPFPSSLPFAPPPPSSPCS